ncbi:MAG: hypothetical protein ABIJ86_08025 [Spirochaetota bacterium]
MREVMGCTIAQETWDGTARTSEPRTVIRVDARETAYSIQDGEYIACDGFTRLGLMEPG